MIPVETVVGITSGWRVIQMQPVLTVSVIVVLLALAFLAGSLSRRKLAQKAILRVVSLSLVLGAAGFFTWAYTTRGPSLTDLAAQVEQAVKQCEGEQPM